MAPVSAACKTAGGASRHGSAQAARVAASVVPATQAASIRRPDTPSPSVTTLLRLIVAPSRTVWTRVTSRRRSAPTG
jgi:hypothetical protein